MSGTFIVDGVRTPVGRYAGALSSVRPDDLAAFTLRSLLDRVNLDGTIVDEVILGNANQAGEDNRNVARMALLLAGLPVTVPGITVNRLCASGMSAISMGSQMIASGAADIVIAGGVESMSRAPWVMAKPEKAFAKPGAVFDTSIGWRFTNPQFSKEDTYSMPETAQEVANREGITREAADTFALESQRRAAAAIREGRFEREIVPVVVPGRKGDTVVAVDEGPRPETTLEALAALKPVTALGDAVTAGNASSLNDGASAVLLASEKALDRYGLTARARVVDGVSVGLEPAIMGLGPVPATQKLLERTGLSVADIGSVELNEAFATQSLACIQKLGLDPSRVNAWGGAIALGHPLGSSGSRISITLINRMEQEGSRYGLATMCIGVGQGAALLLEHVS